MRLKRLDSIQIDNIRGISSRRFELGLIPNKPSLLVAPNGFGKSSIAAAFAYLKPSRIDLPKDYFHRGDEMLPPNLIVRYTLDDGQQAQREASESKNELNADFDIHVINSRLISKAKKLKISGASVVSAAIEVSPIVLVKTIPERLRLKYSYTSTKTTFGSNGKLLPIR